MRAHEIRPGWVLSIPQGRWCSHWPTQNPQPTPAAFQRPVPKPRYCTPSTQGQASRGIIKSSRSFTRPAFPLPVTPGWDGSPWASPPSFTPRRYQQRMSGWGQALKHWPGLCHQHKSVLRSHISTHRTHPRVALPSCLPDPCHLTVLARPVVVRAAPALTPVPGFRLPSASARPLRRACGSVLSSLQGSMAPRGARGR